MHSTPQYCTIEGFSCNAPYSLLVLQHSHSVDAQQLQTKIASPKVIVLHPHIENAMKTLLEELQQQLQQNPVGMQVVICGDEVFIWDVQHAVAQQGCLAEEISLILDHSTQHFHAKKVYCVHCFHLQVSSQEEYLQCEKCQVELYIRSHFSERLGAYMGVCAHPQQTHLQQLQLQQTGAKFA